FQSHPGDPAPQVRHQLHVHEFDPRRRVAEGRDHERASWHCGRKPGRLLRACKMSVAPSPRFARLADDLTLPLTAALLVTGIVRLLLSVKAACEVLQCDDFGRFWYGTSAWWAHGTSLYALTPASVSDDGLAYLNLNLPHTHVLFLPFIALPLWMAAAAWLV